MAYGGDYGGGYAGDYDYNLMLLDGSSRGDSNAVETAIWNGANVKTAKDEAGNNALHLACYYGREMIAFSLLDNHGMDVHAEGWQKETPLHKACQYGDAYLAGRLVERYGANPDAVDASGSTPLQHAKEYFPSKEQGVKDAVSAAVAARNSAMIAAGEGPSDAAAAEPSGAAKSAGVVAAKPPNVRLSAVDQHDLHAHVEEKNKELLDAAESGDSDAVEAAIGGGADIHKAKKMGNNALHLACARGRTAIAMRLITTFEMDVHAVGWYRETPLHKACKYGHADLAGKLKRVLLEAGADSEPVNSFGKQPLDLARQYSPSREPAVKAAVNAAITAWTAASGKGESKGAGEKAGEASAITGA